MRRQQRVELGGIRLMYAVRRVAESVALVAESQPTPAALGHITGGISLVDNLIGEDVAVPQEGQPRAGTNAIHSPCQ